MSDAKRRRLEVPPAKVLGRDEYLAKLRDVLHPMVQPAAMYSSLVDGITKDQELMAMPIHDHAIVRGHAIFDTCSVVDGRLYRLDIHLDRHMDSAGRAQIPLPFGSSVQECKDKMRSIIAQTVVASGLRDGGVRFYTSVGPGTFGVTPDGCKPAFYVLVLRPEASPVKESDLDGVHEVTVNLPLKPPLLASTKSNNYLLNALTAMKAREAGGQFGVLLDGDGCVAESSVLCCVFITEDKRLITPSFDRILAGTTARKVLDLGRRLVAEGQLVAVSQEQIPQAVAKRCVEMLLCGGDSHIIPVTRWDGHPVGSGSVGPITKKLIELVHEDARAGDDDHYELCYP